MRIAWIGMSLAALLLAACGSEGDTTPACGPGPNNVSPCVCEDDGSACSSSAECCSSLCDHATGTCGGESACNPITNAPCNASGDEVCTGNSGRPADNASHWDCLAPAGEKVALCGACGPNIFCEGGLACYVGGSGSTCAKTCCDSTDCGSGVCVQFGDDPVVGVCLEAVGGGPVCDPPLPSPSGGSCFTPE